MDKKADNKSPIKVVPLGTIKSETAEEKKLEEIFQYVKTQNDSIMQIYEWMGSQDQCSRILDGSVQTTIKRRSISAEGGFVCQVLNDLNNEVFRLKQEAKVVTIQLTENTDKQIIEYPSGTKKHVIANRNAEH